MRVVAAAMLKGHTHISPSEVSLTASIVVDLPGPPLALRKTLNLTDLI